MNVLPHSPLFSLLVKAHPTSESVVDEGRKSLGNHGYQTRAAMEETSRQSAEAADDDDSASEVEVMFKALYFGSNMLCLEFGNS